MLRLWAWLWLRRTPVAAAAANAAYASIVAQTDQHTAADAAADAAAAEALRTGGDNIQQWHAKQQFDDTSLDNTSWSDQLSLLALALHLDINVHYTTQRPHYDAMTNRLARGPVVQFSVAAGDKR